MADEFMDEWKDKDNNGLYFYQFFERKHESVLLYITKYLESIPSLDSNSNYLIIDARKRNILGDLPVKVNNIYYWIGAKSINYDRNFSVVVDCLKYISGENNLFIEFQFNESLQFLSNFRRMTKDAKNHFYAIQYFNSEDIDTMPKVLCFEIIDITKDETSKYYFRIYETAKVAESTLDSSNCYIYLDGVYDPQKSKDIYCKAILYSNLYFENKSKKSINKEISDNEDSKSEGEESKSNKDSHKEESDEEKDNKGESLDIGIIKSDELSQGLVLFINNYLQDLKEFNPELEIEIKGEEFWNEINEHSNLLSQYEMYWPLENNEFEAYEIDDDISCGLVYPVDTWDWRIKSPDEIENTKDEDHIVKYEIENEMMITFKQVDEEFDPEKFYIYRVSIVPYTEDSVIK